jgi:hypothetical protein
VNTNNVLGQAQKLHTKLITNNNTTGTNQNWESYPNSCQYEDPKRTPQKSQHDKAVQHKEKRGTHRDLPQTISEQKDTQNNFEPKNQQRAM